APAEDGGVEGDEYSPAARHAPQLDERPRQMSRVVERSGGEDEVEGGGLRGQRLHLRFGAIDRGGSRADALRAPQAVLGIHVHVHGGHAMSVLEKADGRPAAAGAEVEHAPRARAQPTGGERPRLAATRGARPPPPPLRLARGPGGQSRRAPPPRVPPGLDRVVIFAEVSAVAAAILWWGRLPGPWRRALAVLTSGLGVLFLVGALRAEGHREAATMAVVVLGPAYVTEQASASASLPYYVLTGVCLLLGTAGFAVGDATARRLGSHWMATAVV